MTHNDLGFNTLAVHAGREDLHVARAARAAQLGRPVGAVPGPVTSAASYGPNDMLRQGTASVVAHASDVLRLLDDQTVPVSRPTTANEFAPTSRRSEPPVPRL